MDTGKSDIFAESATIVRKMVAEKSKSTYIRGFNRVDSGFG